MNEANKKSIIAEVGGWLWGTIEGGFNEQQTVSQIVVDAVIGMIPLLGDVTAVRDLIAVILRLVEHPEKRKDKLEWLTLTMLLFALIPVLGGAIKGVGKLAIEASKGASKSAEILSEIVECLNRVGEGNAVKFIKELNFDKYTGDILGQWHKLVQRIDDLIEGVLRNARILIPDAMINRLRQIQHGIRELRTMGEDMIPESLKELNRRLKEIQKQIHKGEWHEISSSLSSKTREAEARLVEDVVDGTPRKVWKLENPPFPPNVAEDFRPARDYPDLGLSPWFDSKKGGAWVVASFSGPMRAVRLTAGTRIYRVLGAESKKAGNFWLYKLPKDGPSWRKECAVLDFFSDNGRFIEFVVPEDGIWAWEGKIASQIENTAMGTFGQFLPGGGTQIFIDFTFNEANFKARGEALKLVPQKTNWTGLSDINVPEKNVTVQDLGPNEIETKKASTAAEGQRAVHAQDQGDGQER
jgi:hypothetical protein